LTTVEINSKHKASSFEPVEQDSEERFGPNVSWPRFPYNLKPLLFLGLLPFQRGYYACVLLPHPPNSIPSIDWHEECIDNSS
jgi:hypothetical protein